MKIRVGHGFDVHPFGSGDHLMIGGVRLDYDGGVEAHSDGDVAIHALCDALLGAATLGDLGEHFPSDDDKWEGASGSGLLSRVADLLDRNGWQVANCDITVICERPKIAPHADAMRQSMAGTLGISKSAVSIKATTTEMLGFCGRGEGIAAMAVALIQEKA